MNLSTRLQIEPFEIVYPDSDGQPMTESDPTRDYLIYCVEALNIYFQNRPDVYISGNMFVYYEQGVPDAVVSPDVFVVFGVEKKKRRSYKLWEENGIVPSFVMEITSKTTQRNDEIDKRQKYRDLGVLEYFQYDPTSDYLQPLLKGSRLVDGQYQAIAPAPLPNDDVSIYSQTLNLELRLTNGELRFYEPQTGYCLLNHAETEQARQQAELERQQAELERQQVEQALQQEMKARRDAVPRLLAMGLSREQVAAALGLPLGEVGE